MVLPIQELTFSSYFNMEHLFTFDKIALYLCGARAKAAKQTHKMQILHVLSNDIKYNHHLSNATNELYELLPPRRKWLKIGKEKRYNENGQKFNSIEYNKKCIFITIKHYEKKHPNEPFIIKLKAFVGNIQKRVNDPNFQFETPSIYPKCKKEVVYTGDKNICRPISLFSLQDKIIISFTNKYLTEIFDTVFYDKSFAFRAPIKGEALLTHHDAVKCIIGYKKKLNTTHLWVGECDMAKFYDSVNHKIIIKQFDTILKRLKRKGITVDSNAKKVFRQYLDCYTFNHTVLSLDKESVFKDKIPNGEFGWVEKEFSRLKLYKNIETEKIGIPQGGALSGLIANLVLDFSDRRINRLPLKNMLYVRFCDDMILLHPNKYICHIACFIYKRSLHKLKLIPHDFKDVSKLERKKYWNEKSKKPYRWSNYSKLNDSIPWIGFVGYELNFDGSIRIRKSSLKREKAKQNKVISNIVRAISNSNNRARKKTIIESAHNQLNGMSVGRVHMWNHKTLQPDMCWVNGFKLLEDNKYVEEQLKYLDKHRNRYLHKLKKHLTKINDSKIPTSPSNRKPIRYNKPYSYYYNTLKK
jgi:hypothetical protein